MLEHPNVQATIQAIERELIAFYHLTPACSALDYLLADSQRPDTEDRRGCTWVYVDEASDELYIGLHFDASVLQVLSEHPPHAELASLNLDAFCVVVEELSHFHLLLARAAEGRVTSRLELEWQGEIDKVLLAALFLERQVGHSQLSALVCKIFDEATFIAPVLAHYHEANRHAARFWWQAVRAGRGVLDVAALLRRNFTAPLAEKHGLHRQRLFA